MGKKSEGIGPEEIARETARIRKAADRITKRNEKEKRKRQKKGKREAETVEVYAPPFTYLDGDGEIVHYPGTPMPEGLTLAEWSRKNPPRRADRVAIVGFWPGTYQLAPLGEEGWECWGFNPPGPWHRERIHQFSRWFELHDLEIHAVRRPWYVDWLRDVDRAMEDDEPPLLYTQQGAEAPGFYEAKRFPKAEIEALVPHGRYHAGSFDWLMAMAVLMGFPEIWVYGVAFYAHGEPYSARPCLEYWSGVAEGRGLRVFVDEIGDPAQEILRNCTPEDFEQLSAGSPQYGWETANWLTAGERLGAALDGKDLADPWAMAPGQAPKAERSDEE